MHFNAGIRPLRAGHRIFVGCSGWDAMLDAAAPPPVGRSGNPFGAGAAACLVAADLFRVVFLDGAASNGDVVFSALLREARPSPDGGRLVPSIDADAVLVGAGAIGNAAAWALSRSGVAGRLHVVDPQTVDLSNIQRYVMAERADEGAIKAPLLQDRLAGALEMVPHTQEWAQFVEEFGYRWDHVLVALDTA
jgi:ThiF family